VGNLLQGDDGVGVRLAQELARRNWPPEVEILEVGAVGGPHLLGLWEEAEAALIMDAARFGGAPGEVRPWTFRPAGNGRRAVPENGAIPGSLDPHESSVLPALYLAEALGIGVPVRVIGIQPGSVQLGIGLSPEVEKAWPQLIQFMEREIIGLLGQEASDDVMRDA
jgi:hydrogenase maturation protease